MARGQAALLKPRGSSLPASSVGWAALPARSLPSRFSAASNRRTSPCSPQLCFPWLLAEWTGFHYGSAQFLSHPHWKPQLLSYTSLVPCTSSPRSEMQGNPDALCRVNVLQVSLLSKLHHLRVCTRLVPSVLSDSKRPCGRQPTRLLCPWESPGEKTGVAGRARGIFLTQGSNPHLFHLLHWQVSSLPLAFRSSPSPSFTPWVWLKSFLHLFLQHFYKIISTEHCPKYKQQTPWEPLAWHSGTILAHPASLTPGQGGVWLTTAELLSDPPPLGPKTSLTSRLKVADRSFSTGFPGVIAHVNHYFIYPFIC